MRIIETKVIAAASGSGLGAAVGTFLTWLLGVTIWGAPASAEAVSKAVSAVPQPVFGLLTILVGVAGAAIGGYVAPHTTRPDLTATETAVEPVPGDAPEAVA